MLQVIVVAAIIGLDQLVKYLVKTNIDFGVSIPVISGFLSFTHVENTGAAFSILQNMRWPLIIITFLFLIFAVFVLAKGIVKHPLGVWSVTVVIAGAGGNLIDRIAYGHVTDMFQFDFIQFAIFNVADVFLVCGGILVCVYYILFFETEKTGGKADPDGQEDSGEHPDN